jgi:endoglucanase
MGPELLRRLRWLLPALAGIAFAILISVLGQAPGAAAGVPLSIAVQDNHFVNGAGQTVRLLGVNHASFEYACEYGYAYNDGHMDDADAAAIASWHATAVRVPLNEDCWLGINNRPNTTQGEALTQAGYQQAVEEYVSALHAHGLYAILDLHWSGPGAMTASGQQPMPDDHSAAFWTSVTSTFKSDPAVVFDVFNEPYSPGDPRSGTDPAHPVSWDCWVNGGCPVPSFTGTDTPTVQTYTAVGMQALVTAIRATGATQPVLVGGLDYANDLTQWLDHAPDDPLNQEAASFHNYQGKACDNATCWNTTIASVAANVPVVTGEFDADDFDNATCANKAPSTFDTDYMTWADQHGVSYTAWGWEVLSAQEISDQGCSAYYLTSDPGGTPAAPNGTALHDHLAALAALAAGGSPTTGTTTKTTGGAPSPGSGKPRPAPGLQRFSTTVKPDGTAVRFLLRSSQDCAGVLSGQTVSSFAITTAKRRRHRVSMGTIHFKLTAGRSKTVVLKLSKASRRLLSRQHKLKVQITITLTNSAKRRAVSHRTVTLKTPARRRH